MDFRIDPIIDAFVLCGYKWSQLQRGFRWVPDGVLEEIKILETIAPCQICNVPPAFGFVPHATIHHSAGQDVQFDLLKKYRLCCGTSCLMCNLMYANEDEKSVHINMHLTQRSVNIKIFPNLNRGPAAEESITERAVRLKTFLHFNFYKTREWKLYLAIPSWLQGVTVKDKLRSIDVPTYIPVSISAFPLNLFNNNIWKHYDVYSTILYVPNLDEEFNGVRQYNRMYGKLIIQLLASIKQQPECMRNIRFLPYKEAGGSLFLSKYLVYVTNDDIKEVIKDVLLNKRTVVCYKDLFDDNGCVELECMCFVHTAINFALEASARDPLDQHKTLNRHDETRFDLGMFELVVNPSSDLWLSFAEEVIRKKDMELTYRTPYFVYVVLCVLKLDTSVIPSLQNVSLFSETGSYEAYVGYSHRAGIPPHHFPDTQANDIDSDEMEMREGPTENEQNIRVTGTELKKRMHLGNRELFMIRNFLEDSYEAATKLEAVLQLYEMLADTHQVNRPVRFINKRLEMYALSFITISELEVILRLIELRLPLFYESPESLCSVMKERGLNEIDWGIIKKPFFINEIVRMPL